MKISQNGIALIKRHEGCCLTSYQDSGGIWTIGYGHIVGVCDGQTISQQEADLRLLGDVASAETCINSLIKSPTQNQFDALCSFVFNLGCMSLRNSTLLRKYESGDFAGAADEFMKWNHCAGMVLPGLTARREDERALFLS